MTLSRCAQSWHCRPSATAATVGTRGVVNERRVPRLASPAITVANIARPRVVVGPVSGCSCVRRRGGCANIDLDHANQVAAWAPASIYVALARSNGGRLCHTGQRRALCKSTPTFTRACSHARSIVGSHLQTKQRHALDTYHAPRRRGLPAAGTPLLQSPSPPSLSAAGGDLFLGPSPYTEKKPAFKYRPVYPSTNYAECLYDKKLFDKKVHCRFAPKCTETTLCEPDETSAAGAAVIVHPQ